MVFHVIDGEKIPWCIVSKLEKREQDSYRGVNAFVGAMIPSCFPPGFVTLPEPGRVAVVTNGTSTGGSGIDRPALKVINKRKGQRLTERVQQVLLK